MHLTRRDWHSVGMALLSALLLALAVLTSLR
jgi:hypothetical protein